MIDTFALFTSGVHATRPVSFHILHMSSECGSQVGYSYTDLKAQCVAHMTCHCMNTKQTTHSTTCCRRKYGTVTGVGLLRRAYVSRRGIIFCIIMAPMYSQPICLEIKGVVPLDVTHIPRQRNHSTAMFTLCHWRQRNNTFHFKPAVA